MSKTSKTQEPEKQKQLNSTFFQKAELRSRTLMMIEKPVVLETNGGYGRLFQRCYRHLKDGVVLEADPVKAAALGLQRPTWAVYECKAERALADGIGSHLEVNFLDLDPYGEPWPTVDAFFQSKRPFPNRLAVVVNDGLRQTLRFNAWSVGSMQQIVSRLGNKIAPKYLEICRDMLSEKAGRAGYKLAKWTGYYCGQRESMTHYAAVFEK
jgi:hypothetical protein